MHNCIKLLILIIVWSCITSDAFNDTSDAFNDTSLLINCGLPVSTQSKSISDGRVWQSDDDPDFAPSYLNTVSTSFSENADDLPYKVGRVFWSDITYTFTLTPGPKFIRLYFFPNVSFNNTLPHQFLTSLVANSFTLLDKFNPFLNSQGKPFIILEFLIFIQNDEDNLNLIFSPESPGILSNGSPDGLHGYVNGIEIESIPDGLYLNDSNLIYTDANDPEMGYTFDKDLTALQTAYRLNVGGEIVDERNDNPGGMKRKWDADEDYVVGERGIKLEPDPKWVSSKNNSGTNAAPKIVYGTARSMGDNSAEINLKRDLTWVFQVDPGFDYLVRLHFCELDANVTGIDERVMNLYIDGNLAEEDLDIWYEAGGFGIPVYKDYVITVPAHNPTTASKAALSLALRPLRPGRVIDVSLSGLEILKVSDTARNLAVPNPPYNSTDTTSLNQTPISAKSSIRKTLIIIGSVITGLLLVSVIILALFRSRLQYKKLFTSANSSRPSLQTDLCRRFSLSQIRVATHDFDQNLIIGRGGFGKVYKGCIDGGATDVAVKRLNSTSKQGEQEFLTEIEMLSRLRHRHLVSLIGYCDEKGEMILIYEYMPRGTLRDHLSYRDTKGTSNNQVLSWNQRLMICLGSARGLEYLHGGTKQLIIHRDVKSTNILLDDKWTAKVSDFGLSKVGPASDTGVGHVSTIVKGSFGYLDPEYYQRGQLTEKSDVYSFGVMLFEVLCARPAVELNLPKVRACYTKGILYTVVDPTLTGQITSECLSKFGEIAELCIRANRDERPSMRDVVLSLEFMLTLQQTAENTGDISLMVDFTIRNNATCGGENGASTISFGENVCESRAVGVDTQGSIMVSNTAVTNSHMEVKSGSVFSEIFDLRAR
ncbi:receptor-like protein kinase FERONIA [Silene latifolia]|uniref:receptor-like protein kinase FERONIA n=1 Tax=Silene latifolia TaxID=37657 RepID=UPI003D783879